MDGGQAAGEKNIGPRAREGFRSQQCNPRVTKFGFFLGSCEALTYLHHFAITLPI